MRHLLLIAAFGFSAFTSAFPAFNTPNSVDVNGDTCPLVDRPGLTCPLLCVRDFNDCPDAIKPEECAKGEELCDDGSCQSSCADVVNPCLCGMASQDVSQAYKSCPAYGKTVTVKNFDPATKDEQLEFTCAKSWDLVSENATFKDGTNIPDWAANATDTRVWNMCPTAQLPQMTFTESFCIAFYTIIGAELLLYSLWHMYKKVRERHASRLRQLCSPLPTKISAKPSAPAIEKNGISGSGVAEKESHSDIDANSVELTSEGLQDGIMLLRGFDRNIVGELLYYLTLLSTAGWLVLLAVVVSDYYGDVKGGVAYGLLANSDTSMAVFIFVWHLGGIWMITMLVCKKKLRNYFRIECPLTKARVVQVEERQAKVILMEGEQNKLTVLANRLRDALVGRLNLDVVTETCYMQKFVLGDSQKKKDSSDDSGKAQWYIEYHCTRYVLNMETGKFQSHLFDLGDTHRELLSNKKGLSSAESTYRSSHIGENFIRVAVPSFPIAMLEEFFNFFYLYQMMCMWVWFYFNYYQMALVQFSVIIISALIKVVIRLRSELKVKSLAEHKSECRVKRDGKWSVLNTADLVPGDIVAVEAGMEVMCDGCVVKGEVVVDESSLTGEAMPVRKLPLKNDDIPYDAEGAGKIYSVYSGTRVLQCTGSMVASPSQSQPTLYSGTSALTGKEKEADGTAPVTVTSSKEPETLILVTRTRTATDKGKLIQRILFPTQYSFVFDEQLRVALVILLTYGGVGFALSIWLMGHDVTSWFYGVFVISEIMSPLLPAALVVGQSVAADRLRRQQIYCVDLPRIMMAGKVQVFCFDKTGTLTKEGLEYFAVQAITKGQHEQPSNAAVFVKEETDMTRLSGIAQIGFASCHAVASIGDQLIGNPVDVEQFRATDWELRPAEDEEHYLDTLVSPFLESLSNNSNGRLTRQTLHVVKRFEFVHARQSMSVAVLDKDTDEVHVFVKGSFERLKHMVNQDSVPADYDSVTAKWAKEGCYVLALAHKCLGKIDDLGSISRMPREQLESGCDLVALLLFRNKLKDDTSSAIMELKGGNTRTVMITGDTALTGVYIARQCGMVSPTSRVILGDMEKDGSFSSKQLVWRDTVDDQPVDEVDRLLRLQQETLDEADLHVGDIVAKRTPTVELAVTSAAFQYLVETGQIRRYLFDIRVFARMTPIGKVECVNLHMERVITAMCGDGGNDCGALRAAHVGIALSESEASIVSPFSTNNRSIHSCVTLLREGRAGLATSFAGYKFLINYATTMSMLEIVQFYFSVIVPQKVWIMIDSFIAVGLCIAVTQAKTARKLAPSRPTARLIGTHTLASIWGQTIINYAFLYGMMGLLFAQSWFRCHEFDSRDIDTSLWWLLGDNYEAEIISIVCLFQFVNGAGVYNFGYRYRRSWITNYILAFLYCGFMAAISVLTLADPNRFGCVFRINCGDPDTLVSLGYSRPDFHIPPYNSPNKNNVLPHKFRWTLWGLCVTNIVLCLMYEKFVVLGPIGRRIKRWWVARKGDSKPKLKL